MHCLAERLSRPSRRSFWSTLPHQQYDIFIGYMSFVHCTSRLICCAVAYWRRFQSGLCRSSPLFQTYYTLTEAYYRSTSLNAFILLSAFSIFFTKRQDWFIPFSIGPITLKPFQSFNCITVLKHNSRRHIGHWQECVGICYIVLLSCHYEFAIGQSHVEFLLSHLSILP